MVTSFRYPTVCIADWVILIVALGDGRFYIHIYAWSRWCSCLVDVDHPWPLVMVFLQLLQFIAVRELCNLRTLPDWSTSLAHSGSSYWSLPMPNAFHWHHRAAAGQLLARTSSCNSRGFFFFTNCPYSRDYTVWVLVGKLWLCNVMFSTPCQKSRANNQIRGGLYFFCQPGAWPLFRYRNGSCSAIHICSMQQALSSQPI